MSNKIDQQVKDLARSADELNWLVEDVSELEDKAAELEKQTENDAETIEELKEDNMILQDRLDNALAELDEIKTVSCAKCNSLITGLNQKRIIQKEN